MWVCLNKICQDKKEGGLGIKKNLELFNLALILIVEQINFDMKKFSLWWRDIIVEETRGVESN